MASIAKKYEVSEAELHNMNKQLSEPENVMEGMKLKVPKETSSDLKEMKKYNTTDDQVATTVKDHVEVTEEVDETEIEDIHGEVEYNRNDRFPLPNDNENPKPLPYIREDEYFDKQIVPYNETSYDELVEATNYNYTPNSFEDSWSQVTYEPIQYFDPYAITEQNTYNRLYYSSYRNGCGCKAAPMNYGYMNYYY
ncbi:hypothetical protein GCM10008935_09830 [Alkalibacillus silvisoli]|uniref:LysM domain-containing protein n=2 Tax=Alkalibacillus silvisoli TaxID=392823 RepID=A0ABN0ZS93_9BACI